MWALPSGRDASGFDLCVGREQRLPQAVLRTVETVIM
jgi:hypothetical protein